MLVSTMHGLLSRKGLIIIKHGSYIEILSLISLSISGMYRFQLEGCQFPFNLGNTTLHFCIPIMDAIGQQHACITNDGTEEGSHGIRWAQYNSGRFNANGGDH